MKTVRVTFANGTSLVTGINGTNAEVREYYRIGRVFNLGDGAGGDLMSHCTAVQFIESPAMWTETPVTCGPYYFGLCWLAAAVVKGKSKRHWKAALRNAVNFAPAPARQGVARTLLRLIREERAKLEGAL